MAKKIFILILALIILLTTFTSCGLDYRFALDEKLHNQIELVWGDDKPSHLIYQGDVYNYGPLNEIFDVDHDNIMLSWNGYRYVGYIEEYYSYTSESPLFIYEKRLRRVFFHKDYDYLTDTFVIGDTNEEIVFGNISDFEEEDIDIDYFGGNYVEVYLKLKTNSRIQTSAYITYIDNEWHVFFFDNTWLYVCKASNEFINTLRQNGLI